MGRLAISFWCGLSSKAREREREREEGYHTNYTGLLHAQVDFCGELENKGKAAKKSQLVRPFVFLALAPLQFMALTISVVCTAASLVIVLTCLVLQLRFSLFQHQQHYYNHPYNSFFAWQQSLQDWLPRLDHDGIHVSPKQKHHEQTQRQELPTTTNLHPVDCNQLLAQRIALGDPNEHPNQFVQLVHKSPAPHSFHMSLHNATYDPMRWKSIATTGRYYETVLERIWGTILRRALLEDSKDNIHVVDVGGNVGYYALYSAAFDTTHASRRITVDSFEPNPLNLLRTCESLQLNQWNTNNNGTRRITTDDAAAAIAENDNDDGPNIRLWQYGMSNQSDQTLHFVVPHRPFNPGGGQVVTRAVPGRSMPIRVMTLDDFGRAQGWWSSIEILKVDVERHEGHVLQGAHELLARHVVRHVFVEVGRDVPAVFIRQGLQHLLSANYTLCRFGYLLGPAQPVPPELTRTTTDEEFLEAFIVFLKRRRMDCVNLWWSQSADLCFE